MIYYLSSNCNLFYPLTCLSIFITYRLMCAIPNLNFDYFYILLDYVNSKLLPPVPEDLDTMEPPESLLTVDLPNMIQNRMQQSLLSKMSENSQGGNYSASVGTQQEQQQAVYYSMNQMPESNRNSSSTSNLPSSNVPQQLQPGPSNSSTRSTRALLKDNHSQPHGRSSSGGYANPNSRNDVFAVPKVRSVLY